MAEVVGLAASIIAIIGIAETATKVARSLLRIARKAGTARDDIQTLASSIMAFSAVIQVAHDSLKAHHQKDPKSPVLKYIAEHKVLRDLKFQSDIVEEHIENIEPQLRTICSRIDLLTRFRWWKQESEVKALGPEMESVKTNLLVLMHVIVLEVLRQKEPSEETNREMYAPSTCIGETCLYL